MPNWFQRASASLGETLLKYGSRDLLNEIMVGQSSTSGVNVTWQSALQVSTVLACVRVLANGVSQVPFRLYKTDGRSRNVAQDHDLNDLLYRRPNQWQSSYEFRETLMLHLGLFWNAYVFVNRVGVDRKIVELIPIEPQYVTVERVNPNTPNDLRVLYKVRSASGATREFPSESIWHLKGPSWTSWAGMDAMKLARNAIGLADALEQSHAKMHSNGARMSGMLSVEGKLNADQYSRLKSWLEKYQIGGEYYHKPIVMDQAAKWSNIAQTGVDSQHLETRKFQIEEICRDYGVMPIMVGLSDKTATYASAEQMFLAHVVHSLMPWYERIEQSADVNLLTDQEREDGFYCKFTPNALMRGAAKDRAEYYAKALGSGGTPAWMAQNEVRDLEELNPYDQPGADELARGTASSTPGGDKNNGDSNED